MAAIINYETKQNHTKKWALACPLVISGEAPVVADLPDNEQTGHLAKNLERCKHV